MREAKAYALYTQPQYKDCRLVYSKHALDPITAQTYPYGHELVSDSDSMDTLLE